MAATAAVSAKHRVFTVPFDQALANLIPGAKPLTHPSVGHVLVIPHARDTTRLARNLGYSVPAPILAQYDWNQDKPFRTQMVTAALLTMQPRAYVLSQMGTGKTRAALHAANFLMLSGDVRRAIVVAPLSTLANVWDREIFQYFGHLSTAILHGTKAQRLRELALDREIYIINHDGVETILPALIAKQDIDLVLIDEIASFRNARTDRWKALNVLVNGSPKIPGAISRPFAWGLTGSPTPNEPPDAWGQCRLLTPARVPPYFKQFKRQCMLQVSQFKWIPRAEANDIVYDAMQPAVRYLRDDCVELPETIFQNRLVAMSAEQDRVYKELIRRLKLGFKEGTVTAANEGVLYSKLLQIASGYVYTTDRRIVALDHTDRTNALLEMIEESEGKVIVFADFIHVAHALQDILLQQKISSALITGETSPKDRNRIFSAFQGNGSPRVLVAHPKCMSHGLTLVSASTIIWWTPTTSLETYEQACARITRPGQQRKTFIVGLTGTPIESRLYRRLQQRASTQGALLEMFESQE